MSLDDEEFVRRFLMHVPPSGFTKLRFYGFWGNRNRKKRFAHIDEQFANISRSQGKELQVKERWDKPKRIQDALEYLSEKDDSFMNKTCFCPKCQTTLMFRRL